MFFRKQKIAGNDNRREPTQPVEAVSVTVVAAGTRIEGSLACEGELRIEGVVRGHVRAGRLSVLAEGAVEGDISAGEAEVHGQVKGPIHARHVHLGPGSSVEGDIVSQTIAIDTGARLSGAVWQEQAPAAAREARAAVPERTPALFAASLWESVERDGFRPLAAVRPRAGGQR